MFKEVYWKTTKVLGEITSPLTSGFFIYNIFAD